jgi:TctA family transporter
MKHFENDTTAGIATAISGSSAIIHFAQTWQPVVSMCVGLIGIVSGLFAIAYYIKKLNKLNGKD